MRYPISLATLPVNWHTVHYILGSFLYGYHASTDHHAHVTHNRDWELCHVNVTTTNGDGKDIVGPQLTEPYCTIIYHRS